MSRKSKQDWELWERVKKTAIPLQSNRPKPDFGSMLEEVNVSKTKSGSGFTAKRTVKPYVPEPTIRVSLASKPPILDEPTNRKIARGRTPIDGRIDLHGMTQIEAYNRLFQFLDSAFAAGKRTASRARYQTKTAPKPAQGGCFAQLDPVAPQPRSDRGRPTYSRFGRVRIGSRTRYS